MHGRTKSDNSHQIGKGAGKRPRLAMKMQFTRDDSSLYAPCPKSPSASQLDIDHRVYGQDIVATNKIAHLLRTFQKVQIARRGKYGLKAKVSLVRKIGLSLPFGKLRCFKIITLEILLDFISIDIIHLRRTQNLCKGALARAVRSRKNDDFRLFLHVVHRILPVSAHAVHRS